MKNKTPEELVATPAYIGRSPCGCINFATVDEPERAKEIARDLGQVIRWGWTIERVTVQFVRDNYGPGCEQCRKPERKRKKPDQLELELR